MEVTRARTLAATGALALLVVFPLTGLIAERWPQWLTAPWPLSLLLAAVGGGVLVFAWPVRLFVRAKRPAVDALRAATVVAFAKACSVAGAGLGGAYLAVVGRAIVEWSAPAFHDRALLAGLAAAACAWLCAAGQIGQIWCRLPPGPEGAAEGTAVE